MNTSELKQAAKNFGADLVGIAPVSAFAGQPAERDPLKIFPQAKSVIVIGRRILRSTLTAIAQAPRLDASFRHFGFYNLEDNYLAKTTYDLTLWIEARGFEAVPMFSYDTNRALQTPLAIPVAPDKPAPNVQVDWKLAAQLAGLGATGMNGLLLTPQFGTRQRVALMLSDFEFEPDAPFTQNFCEDCDYACMTVCPISGECAKCKNGAIQTDFGRFNTIDKIPSRCGRACLASLERRGLVKPPANAAALPETPAWGFNKFGEIL